jgi:ribonuclease D
MQPDAIRRLAWSPPAEITKETVTEALRGYGAREWQLQLVVLPLVKALHRLETKGDL